MSKRPRQSEEGQANNCRDRSGKKLKYLYLVLDDWHGGFSIRKIEQPDCPDLSAAPVARLGSFMRRSSMVFAAMGSRIIATTHNYAATLVFDTKTAALAMGNPLPDALLDGVNFFLTAGDDMLFAFAYYFKARPHSFEVMSTTKDEMLSLCPGTDWSWESMPSPFTKDERIESYALHPDGQTIFVSTCVRNVSGATFSFDTKNREWKRFGEWTFPFEFQGYFDADLDAWVGLHQDGYVCSCQVPSLANSSSSSTLQKPDCKIAKEHELWSPYHQLAKGRGATLTYMGNSKFFLVDSVAADGVKFQDAFGDHGCVLNMTTFRLKFDCEGNLRIKDKNTTSCPVSKQQSSFSPVAFWI